MPVAHTIAAKLGARPLCRRGAHAGSAQWTSSAERTRRDYQRVINAYRNVYYGAPTSTKADPSVVAVAETLVEMGRRFDDDKILNEAIAPVQVPAARSIRAASIAAMRLFTIGEIYKDDLNDAEQARATFEEFLHRYPQHRLAEDAQREIADLDREAEAREKGRGAEAEKDWQRGGGQEQECREVR